MVAFVMLHCSCVCNIQALRSLHVFTCNSCGDVTRRCSALLQTEGILFFLLAALGAAAVMVTFTTLLAGATAGAVYGLAHMSGRAGVLLGGPTSDGRRRIRGSVPGYSSVDFGTDRYFRQRRHGAFTGADTTAPAPPQPHPAAPGHLHHD